MKSMEGDLLKLAGQGHFDVIVHGCNSFCTMGAGIAKSIRDQFPAACEADLATPKGDRDKLGTFSAAKVIVGEHSFDVVNAYTQFHWRGADVKANDEAIRTAFKSIRLDFAGKRIGYPMIGAGLAAGDWDTISEMICEALVGEDHTMVDFKPS